MYINGRDPVSDGWTLVAVSGWMGGLPTTRGTTALPGLAGVLPASLATTGARSIACTFLARPASLSARDAAVNTLADLCSGRLWVRFDDAVDRVVRCEASPLTVRAVHESATFAVAAIEASVTLTCYDGASYDVEPRVLALSSTGVEVPLGTLPSLGRLTWGGAWSATVARTLTIRDVGGVARATLTLTAPGGASLTSSEFLEIDLGRRYITKVTSSGVRTNAYTWLTSGWPVLDPAWQDRVGTRYATAEISAGTAQLTYRRAYAL